MHLYCIWDTAYYVSSGLDYNTIGLGQQPIKTRYPVDS